MKATGIKPGCKSKSYIYADKQGSLDTETFISAFQNPIMSLKQLQENCN